MKKDPGSCGRNLFHHEFNGTIEIFVIVTTMVIFHIVNVLKENPCFAVKTRRRCTIWYQV
jgi:hypothetical protein